VLLVDYLLHTGNLGHLIDSVYFQVGYYSLEGFRRFLGTHSIKNLSQGSKNIYLLYL